MYVSLDHLPGSLKRQIIIIHQLIFQRFVAAMYDMRPSKLHHGPLNGHRPSPLQIHKESHLIHKSSSSSSTSNSSSSTSIPQQQQRNHPVIIYTQSPKVIHTQAKDFMSLVQKLTGRLSRPSSSDNGETSLPPLTQQKQYQGPNNININAKPAVGHDDNDQSSSVSTDKNCHDQGVSGGGCDVVISPILKPPSNPCFAEVPLFTPTSTDFFCSLRPAFRYPDAVVPSPNMGNPISPSVIEFLKGLPEY